MSISLSPLYIHICTKDRPESLRGLIQDICQILQSDEVRIFVYDDSVLAENRRQNKLAVKQVPCEWFYFDEMARHALLNDFVWPSAQAESYVDYAFKILGNPAWDVAGVRSFAHFIAAAYAEPEDRVLFLDDDIRLTSAVFRGVQYALDASAVRATLIRPLPAKTFIGATYAGRADMTIAEHLQEAQLAGEIHKDLIPAYSGIRKQPSFPILETSGAFLLLHGETIRQVAPAHIFDEDWIFIAQAMARGIHAQKAPFKPIHAGDEMISPKVNVTMILTQQRGHIFFRSLYRAIERLGEDAKPDTVKATAKEYCDYHAQEEVRIWRNLLLPSPLLDRLGWSQSEIAQLLDAPRLVAEASQELDWYFALTPGWQDMFDPRCVSHVRSRLAQQTCDLDLLVQA